jgi:two-component system sensor histidine kinase BaeS
MKEVYLHAIDLATAGEIETAQSALEAIDDAVANRLRDLFAELGNQRSLQQRTQSLLRHEIGNALSIAQANLEGIMDGVLQATPERYAGMHNALESVGRLVDDWRKPPRSLEEKALTIRIDDFNICAIIGAQAALIDGLARAKNVEVYYAPCGQRHSECTHFRGDPQRTGQVLRNVLINAVRYTPPGGRVEIICDRPGAEITLVVRDSGPGIKSEDIAHVFEDGYRGKTAGAVKGSGIGLSVVSQLLGALGGKARVISEEGNGATFVIELPATPLPAPG